MTKGPASAGGRAAASAPGSTRAWPSVSPSGLNIAAIAASVIWAGMYAGVKIVLQDFSATTIALVRPAGQAAALFVMLWLINRRIVRPVRADLPFLVLVGLAYGANQLLFAAAIDHSTASHTVMLYGASPMLVAVMAWIVKLEPPRARVVAGVLVSLVGIGLIVGPGGVDASGDWLLGDLLIFAAMLTWVITTVAAVPLLRRMSPMEELAFVVGLATVFVAPFSLKDTLSVDMGRVGISTWLALAFIVFGNLVAAVLWNRGIRRFGATQTGVYTNVQPVVGVLISVVLLGEQPGPVQLVGMAIIIIGILIARR